MTRKSACWMVLKEDWYKVNRKMFSGYMYPDIDYVIIPFSIELRDTLISAGSLVKCTFPTGWLAVLDTDFVIHHDDSNRMVV